MFVIFNQFSIFIGSALSFSFKKKYDLKLLIFHNINSVFVSLSTAIESIDCNSNIEE